jgi:transcriptional antiterminator RfaH
MVEQSYGGGKKPNEDGTAWYCLRSRRKQEHVASVHIRVLGNIPVFCPTIRFRGVTRSGSPVSVTEALFPGYFFARFSLREKLPQVRSAHGVSGIVRFGDWYPVIEDSIIEELRAETEGSTLRELTPTLVPGDRVRLVVGPLAGLEAVITHVLPGNERVRLLLEFLGGNTLAEASSKDVIPCDFGSTVFKFATRLAASGPGSRLNGAKVRLPEANSQNGVHRHDGLADGCQTRSGEILLASAGWR